MLYGGFKWLNKKQIDKFNVKLIGNEISIGYKLDVDLKYPDELHELHNDCPKAPEKTWN